MEIFGINFVFGLFWKKNIRTVLEEKTLGLFFLEEKILGLFWKRKPWDCFGRENLGTVLEEKTYLKAIFHKTDLPILVIL